MKKSYRFSSRDLIGFIKVEPFIYNIIYVVATISLLFDLSELAAYLINTFIFMSPIFLLFSFIHSTLSNLCKYHKIAIVCPIIGYVAAFINDFVYDFDLYSTYVISGIILLILLITFVCGYKVFTINEERKRQTHI